MKGPCQLMGTGMAFPRKMLAETKLATGCVVEDMKLGLDLAAKGMAPQFLPQATVVSEFPTDESVGDGQRSRWIHGHLEMIVRHTPSLLLSAIRHRRLAVILDAYGFDCISSGVVVVAKCYSCCCGCYCQFIICNKCISACTNFLFEFFYRSIFWPGWWKVGRYCQ